MIGLDRKLTQLFSSGVLIATLAACSAPVALQGPGGNMSVLSLPVGFSVNNLPSGWVLSGDTDPAYISPSKIDPLHELTVVSNGQGYSLIRMTDAVVLATPYLSWRWKISSGTWTYHPLRLLIGFNGGSPHPADSQPKTGLFSSGKQPGHDRGLSIAWGPSALMRGTFTPIRNKKGPVREVQYTVRGGQETTNDWKLETVDLSHLYAKTWPDDDIRKAKIVFIGIGVAKTREPHYASIGDIQLSR
jgi:hypothetical protein